MIAFIIFGTTSLRSTKESGSFFCPNCMNQVTYRHRSVRRFFTLYFIPLIPLDRLGEYIECDNCAGTFNLEVLTLDSATIQEAEKNEFFEDVKRIMVLTMIADGEIMVEEREAAKEFYLRLAARELTDDELATGIDLATQANVQVVDYARSIAPRLGQFGKETIVKAVFLVASATGEIGDQKKVQLELLPAALGITQDDFREIVAAAVEE